MDIAFSPEGADIDAYRLGFAWENRPRFRVRNTHEAELSEEDDCTAVPLQTRLQSRLADGSGPTCPQCTASATGQPPVRLEALAPLLEGRYMREVLVLTDGQWRVVASEELTVTVPEWADSEPVLSLVALIAVLLALLGLISLASSRLVRHRLDPYDEESARLSDIDLVRADGLGAPIVRLGFFTWRGAKLDGNAGVSTGYVSLAGLVAGPLVVRFQSPAGPMDSADDMQSQGQLGSLAKRAWTVARGARTLVVGRRLRYTSFDAGDSRESQLRLVPRIDHG